MTKSVGIICQSEFGGAVVAFRAAFQEEGIQLFDYYRPEELLQVLGDLDLLIVVGSGKRGIEANYLNFLENPPKKLPPVLYMHTLGSTESKIAGVEFVRIISQPSLLVEKVKKILKL